MGVFIFPNPNAQHLPGFSATNVQQQTLLLQQQIFFQLRMNPALLIILDVFIEFFELRRLEDTEADNGDNTENQRVDTAQNQVLCLEIRTCDTPEGTASILSHKS